MRIFDTLSQTKKPLPKSKGALKFFVCGPTVYDLSHIGHARTYIVFDAFVKFLRAKKLKVFYLQNITDIDDKIIVRAKKQKISPIKLARIFEKEYEKDIKSLKITSVKKYARATNHIKEIQKQISALIKKGYAYQTKNGIYFEIKKFKDYGKLSKQDLGKLRHGYKIEPDPDKKDPLDFALWKNTRINADLNTDQRGKKIKFRITKNGEPIWSSPWGWGRPGWHIEDTAITEKYFGPQYDIHGGGNDLKFPHHEAEIAQQESASGKKPLVKIWMHTGFLLVNGEKMSKSLGNFITIRDFLKKHSSEALRLMVLLNHYRSPFNYTEELAKQSEKSSERMQEFMEKLEFVKNSKFKRQKSKLQLKIQKYKNQFNLSLEDDFNTPKAIATIFELITKIQPNIWQLSPKEAQTLLKFIKKSLKIFEIELKPVKIPSKITKKAIDREKFRENKQFIQADQLRKEIEMLGYFLEDTPFGPMVRKKF